MTADEAREKLNQRFQNISNSTDTLHSNMIASSRRAYAKKFGHNMSAAKEAVLKNSVQQMTNKLIGRGHTRQEIASAVADISKVDNPISMLYNLMSILIPNFAYEEVVGIQPMPTKESPVFFPQITANTTRNGVTAGDKLLGATNWETSNNYTTNKTSEDGNLDAATTQTITLATAPEVGSIVVKLTIDGTDYTLIDNYKGGFTGLNTVITAASYDANAKTISITLAAAAAVTDTFDVTYRYDWGSTDNDSSPNTQKPAQILLEWTSEIIKANPYRLRSTYLIENMMEVKQVLSGYDIDAVLASTLGGYINKEISGNVFDDMADRVDASYVWNHSAPAGVPEAVHKLSILDTFADGSYGIRDNVRRSLGNYAVIGTNWMKKISTLGTNVYGSSNWEPETYGDNVPIGPYVAGKLNGIKILYNQDYDPNFGVMGYKKDETDASVVGGVFIGLYSTNPIAKDDLNTVQGMGTQFGTRKIIENSLVGLNYV